MNIAIIGSGGFAKEVLSILRSINERVQISQCLSNGCEFQKFEGGGKTIL